MRTVTDEDRNGSGTVKPEVLRVIDEFEAVALKTSASESTAHPDCAVSKQNKFIKDLSAMISNRQSV